MKVLHLSRRPRVVSRPDGPPAKILRPMKMEQLSPMARALVDWTVAFPSKDRAAFLVVPAETHMARQALFRQYVDGTWRKFHTSMVVDAVGMHTAEWRDDGVGVLNNFVARLEGMHMPALDKNRMASWYPRGAHSTWDLLWSLIAVEDFVVEEPLRGMVGQAFYLVHDLHRVLWEARFAARERGTLDETKRLVDTLTRWMKGLNLTEEDRECLASMGVNRLVTPNERLDAMCFLLTLAFHNGLLQRAILVFDDLDRALHYDRRPVLRQLHAFLVGCTRWSRLGCPLGVLIGFTATAEDMALLTRFNSKLAADVSTALEWTRGL